MENVRRSVGKSQERAFEHKVVELEQSAYRLLALTKELHGNFLAYKEGAEEKEIIIVSANRIVGEIEYLFRAFSDLEKSVRKMLGAEGQKGE